MKTMRFSSGFISSTIYLIVFGMEVKHMCELFGYFGAIERNIAGDLREFFSHSVHHPEGWGLATGECAHLNVEKEPVRAIDSSYLKSKLEGNVTASVAIAHIRLATAGLTSYDNCHPFSAFDASGRQWTFAHNGTILAFDELECFRTEQRGTTDSERVFLYFLSKINEATAAAGRALNAEERFRTIDRLMSDLCANNNKVNILIYDGEQFYAHCNFANSLHVRRDADGVFFSTKALSQGTWTQLPLNTLIAFAPNGLVRFGRKHANESFQDAKTIEAWQRKLAAQAPAVAAAQIA